MRRLCYNVSSVSHPLSWFQERIPKAIVRVRITEDGSKIKSYVQLKDQKWADQCHDTQGKYMYYTDNETASRKDDIPNV